MIRCEFVGWYKIRVNISNHISKIRLVLKSRKVIIYDKTCIYHVAIKNCEASAENVAYKGYRFFIDIYTIFQTSGY